MSLKWNARFAFTLFNTKTRKQTRNKAFFYHNLNFIIIIIINLRFRIIYNHLLIVFILKHLIRSRINERAPNRIIVIVGERAAYNSLR